MRSFRTQNLADNQEGGAGIYVPGEAGGRAQRRAGGQGGVTPGGGRRGR